MFLPLTRWFGELLAFDEADLDRNVETGRTIETVTSKDLNRTHALIYAKRPDDQGRPDLRRLLSQRHLVPRRVEDVLSNKTVLEALARPREEAIRIRSVVE